MTLTKEVIYECCLNEQEFAEAVGFQKNNCIKNLYIDDIHEDIVAISGEVADKRGIVRVKVSVEGDLIRDFSCSRCGGYYWGICKHIAAVLLEYCDQLKQGTIKRVTSKRIKDLIFDYAAMNKKEVFKSKLNREIELAPRLVLENGRARVDFKVGKDRKYVIKDLSAFTDSLMEGSEYAYGKQLAFIHEREAFTDEAQPLLDFIEFSVNISRNLLDTQNGYYGSNRMRYVELSEMELDQFMELMQDKKLLVICRGVESAYTVVKRNPRIQFYIEDKGEGVEIYRDDTYTFAGNKSIYALQGQRLYVSDEEYEQNMRMILDTICPKEEGAVYLSAEDYQVFCASILQVVSEYGEISGGKLDRYTPPPVRIEVYLDSPEKNCVSCSIYGCYDDKRYNVFEKFNPVETYRDVKRECQAYLIGQKYFQGDDGQDEQNRAFYIKNDDEKLFTFLNKGVDDFYQAGNVYISDAFKKIKILPSPKVSIGVAIQSGLLELTLDADTMPAGQLSDLLDSYKRRKKFHKLKNGEFISLENSSFAAFSELAAGLELDTRKIKHNKILIPQNKAIYLDGVLRDGNENVEYHRDIHFKNLIKNIKSVEDAEFELPVSLRPVLRNYQKTGYRWMKTLAAYGFGGILADDMGLGKTLQVIGVLKSLQEEEKGCSLIVCPASLIYNWENEIKKFAPDLKVCVAAGSIAERKVIVKDCAEFDVVITSYDLLKRDLPYYENSIFAMEVIDEAQYIKNQGTQASRAVKAIKAGTKFALTGTPIENRLSELWSIFDFIMPGFLYNYNRFREEIEYPVVQEQDEVSLKRLHRLIRPFILRRLKKDVLRELPDKLEDVVYSKMTGEQKKLYQAGVYQLKESIGRSSDTEVRKNKLEILAELTKLRQICCDPSLYYEGYKGGSAKLDTCMELVENAVNSGHKILLFSQFTTMLDNIAKRLEKSGISYYMLTGHTAKADRYKMVENFNGDDTKVFLISLKAGGTGLNLTGADIVIHYDPWWNVSAQNQATDRAHRIGQKKVVSVFRLITGDSIEEKILQLQEKKKDLADKVISAEGMSAAVLDKNELLELLD